MIVGIVLFLIGIPLFFGIAMFILGLIIFLNKKENEIEEDETEEVSSIREK